jgi:hypothetical protein
MPNLTLPVYENELEKLEVYPNLKAAKDWLKECEDTSGTTILIPFKEDNKIRFLKPSHFNSFLDENGQDQDKVSNKNIRIIGAMNDVHIHGFFKKIKAALEKNRVPHLNDLEEDELSLAEHGFIIIYEKGGHKVGHQFAQLFQEEKQNLLKKIEEAQKNNEPHINPTEFLEKISKLALGLDIKQGMTYFVTTDKEGIQHVYRHTFKQDPTNDKVNQLLQKEKEKHGSKEVVIDEHKFQNHHIIQFLKDWCKWTIFSAITAIGAGLTLGFFIAPPIGTIAAALVSVITFVGVSGYGFYRADKNNPTTTEFGEFEVESQSIFYRLKQLFNRIPSLFSKKIVTTLASPVVANDNHIKTEELKIKNVAQNQNLSTNQFFSKVEKDNSDNVSSSSFRMGVSN